MTNKKIKIAEDSFYCCHHWAYYEVYFQYGEDDNYIYYSSRKENERDYEDECSEYGNGNFIFYVPKFFNIETCEYIVLNLPAIMVFETLEDLFVYKRLDEPERKEGE